ncbi:MAG: transglutaminase-like domain-containing protein [Leptospirales bacterium]|nr:transglutaminase-like domain-containing protein [Leptospirales bacterium]
MRSLAILLLIIAAGGLTAGEKQASPYNFTHESFNDQRLAKLRETGSFENYISAGKTEYEQMVLLKDWVYSNLKYSFRSPVPELVNSLEIMRLAAKGTTFLCVSYAALYLQCALSMGWTSRYIFLCMPDGRAHASVDIWSNQHQKWIYMDPTWNINVEENDVPMSILEIRQRWLSKKFSSMRFIFSGGKKALHFKSSEFPFRGGNSELWKARPINVAWLSYANEVSIVNKNTLFSAANIYDYSQRYIIKDKNNSRALQKKGSIPVDALFSACNVPGYVATDLEDDQGSVEIKLEYNTKTSFTPSFDHFEIENGNKWITVDSKFIVTKKQLETGIKIRTANILGVAGPVVTIKNEDKTKQEQP